MTQHIFLSSVAVTEDGLRSGSEVLYWCQWTYRVLVLESSLYGVRQSLHDLALLCRITDLLRPRSDDNLTWGPGMSSSDPESLCRSSVDVAPLSGRSLLLLQVLFWNGCSNCDFFWFFSSSHSPLSSSSVLENPWSEVEGPKSRTCDGRDLSEDGRGSPRRRGGCHPGHEGGSGGERDPRRTVDPVSKQVTLEGSRIWPRTGNLS